MADQEDTSSVGGGWRYQAVWQADPIGDRYYTICEVYFDDDERLTRWTESAEMRPSGSDLEELGRDLVRMYVDARCWVAVEFSTLQVGMRFRRAVSKENRERLAQMFDAFRVMASPTTESGSDRATSSTEES